LVDILLNNAAFQRAYGKFEDIPDDEFEETFSVNIFAMFRLCKALAPADETRADRLLTPVRSSPSTPVRSYASTKAAIVSFTRSLASLAIKRGVRVNAVAPGPVWTPLIPSTLSKEKVKEFRLSDCLWTRCPARGACAHIRLPSQLCNRGSLRGHRRSDAHVISAMLHPPGHPYAKEKEGV